ncbi:MAG: FG-GAP-like repeat-containing protein [Terriglobales bacterium]
MKGFKRCLIVALLSGCCQFAFASSSSHHSRPANEPRTAFFYSQAVNYQPGDNFPTSVFLADVNGDGKLDVVVANQDQVSGNGAVSVFLGNGDGTLQTPAIYDSGGGLADSVFVIDVNGDGLPDIVVTNQSGGSKGDGSVSVLLNGVNGNPPGTFQLAAIYDSGDTVANAVFVIDVNGDGLPDIVVANQGPVGDDGSVSVLLNGISGNPPGTFQLAATYDSGGVDATAITLADVNGDGRPDLLVANYCFGVNNCPQQQGGVAVLLNNGNGGFSLLGTNATDGPASSIAVGDVNGDGVLDVVAGCGSSGAVLLLGMGGGNFAAYQSVPGITGQVFSVAVQDVNGDGINDLLFGLGYCPACDDGNDSGVMVLLGEGGGNYQTALTYDSGGASVEAMGLGVLNRNGDGNPDLVVTNTCDSGNIDYLCGGNVAVFLNSVNGLTTTLTASLNPVPTGLPVTYSAAVTSGPGNPGGGPNGNITFRDGTTVLATVPVNSNQASYSTTYSKAGTHPITATYSLNQVSQISAIVTESAIKAVNPTLTTLSATSITADGALLKGSVNPQHAPGAAGFYWGTDPTLTSYTPSCTFGVNCPQVAVNATTQSFSASLSGLDGGTTYYFQMVFLNTDNNTYHYGLIKSFKTEKSTVTTSAASSITAGGALLKGNINPEYASGNAGFYWGTDPTLGIYTASCTFGTDCPTVTANATTQSFHDPLTGLAPGTTYYFQMVFLDTNDNSYHYGLIKSFETESPVVTTAAAGSVTASGAMLKGTVNPESAPGNAAFYWGTDPTMSVYTLSCSFGANCPQAAVNAMPQSFSAPLTGLTGNTTYYFQMVFLDTNDNSYHYGLIRSFTTP